MNLRYYHFPIWWAAIIIIMMISDIPSSCQALVTRTYSAQDGMFLRLRPNTMSSKARFKRQVVRLFDQIPWENNDSSSSEVEPSCADVQGQARAASTEISVERIAKLAIPAVGIWLCSPLLSVIDTSAVGLLSGTLQQAALNPAVAVTDYSARCMSFLFTATTNLIAISYEKDLQTVDSKSSQKTLVGAMRVSLRVGFGMCVFLILFGDAMLRGLVGPLGNTSSREVLLAARKYVWIRSLGMPAAAMIGTVQAACIGMQDTKSPLLTTLLAAMVNLVADIVLVRLGHAWMGGVAGAAWATILSQYVAAGCYLLWLSGGRLPGERLWSWIPKKKRARITPGERTWSSPRPGSVSPHKGGSVRGILKGYIQPRDLVVKRKDEPSSAQDFAPFVVPVTTTQVGRCSVYVAMGMVVSGMNVVNMAANQILTAFFYALIPIADSLSQTAQALLPPLFADTIATTTTNSTTTTAATTPESMDRLQRALQSFGKAALLCGTGLVTIVSLIPALTRFIMTTDPAVQSVVNSVVPIHVMIFLFHGVFCASEGVLLAQKDLGFLGKMYGIYFAIVPALILQLQRLGPQLQLHHVWYAFMSYQFFRISAWVGRVYYLFRKRKNRELMPAPFSLEL